jgi:hypothetical protein
MNAHQSPIPSHVEADDVLCIAQHLRRVVQLFHARRNRQIPTNIDNFSGIKVRLSQTNKAKQENADLRSQGQSLRADDIASKSVLTSTEMQHYFAA